MPVRYLWWWDWRIETINEIPVTFSARKRRPLQAVRGRPWRLGRALPSNPEPATSCLSYLSEGQTMELDHQKHTTWESISEMQVSSAGDSHKPMTEYSVWVRTCPIISEILGMSQTNLPSQPSISLWNYTVLCRWLSEPSQLTHARALRGRKNRDCQPHSTNGQTDSEEQSDSPKVTAKK